MWRLRGRCYETAGAFILCCRLKWRWRRVCSCTCYSRLFFVCGCLCETSSALRDNLHVNAVSTWTSKLIVSVQLHGYFDIFWRIFQASDRNKRSVFNCCLQHNSSTFKFLNLSVAFEIFARSLDAVHQTLCSSLCSHKLLHKIAPLEVMLQITSSATPLICQFWRRVRLQSWTFWRKKQSHTRFCQEGELRDDFLFLKVSWASTATKTKFPHLPDSQ